MPKITRRLKRNVIPTKNLPKISTYNPSPKKRPAPKTRLSLTSCNVGFLLIKYDFIL